MIRDERNNIRLIVYDENSVCAGGRFGHVSSCRVAGYGVNRNSVTNM